MIQDNKDLPNGAGNDHEEINDGQNNGDAVKGEAEDDSSVVEVKIRNGNEDSDEATSEEESENGTDEETKSSSEQYLRLAAEFDNYRKRTSREFGEIIKSANTRLLLSLVEIMDNFERALSPEAGRDDGDAYRRGVELIYNQFGDLLEKERVKAIESVGQPFDPNYHEAMMQTETDEYDEGIVCREVQKGYKINDKVLRHARVVVSKGAPRSEDIEE